PGENRYLAIYETDRWDMEDMLGDLRTEHAPTWRERGRCNINLQVTHSGVFRKCGPSTRPEGSGFTTERTGKAPVTGLLVVLDTCTEPSRETSFNNWYNRIYAPAVVAAGLFHTAYRYANTVREPDGRRLFISLYETDSCLPNNEIELLWHQWKTSTARAPDAHLLSEGVFAPIVHGGCLRHLAG
ncbi:MAG: hypothetical protein Q7R39_06290, partial [Dehalococcoidia bacterium]|nr:hypothetical protein [Dehalococcoidia bacterium]